MFLKRMMTTRNVGTLDRVIRAVPAVIVTVFWLQGLISGVTALVLFVLAAMLLVTALTGACSVYYMLGFSTCPVSGAPRDKV